MGLRGEPDVTWTDDKSSVLRVLNGAGPAASVAAAEAASSPSGAKDVSTPAPE
jgi:hypothetical protein